MSRPAPVVIDELNQALSTNPPPTISNDIYRMFLRDREQLDPRLLPDDRSRIARQLFGKAQELYQQVRSRGARFAVFYRIDDRTQLETQYNTARRNMATEFSDWVTRLGHAPNDREINQFFASIQQDLQGRNLTLAGQIRLEVATYFRGLADKRGLQTNVTGNMDTWFTNQEHQVKKLAEPRFYQVPNVDQAYAVGTIYGPGPALHNWGVNAAWALGVTRSGIPIRIISELDMRHIDRSHPNRRQALNPSAFALEIAIAIKMGYGLNIVNNAVTLVPPSVLANHATNGRPGNGPLPTQQEQINIFRRCVVARELHTRLATSQVNLQNHMQTVCLTGNPNDQYDLAVGLNLLLKGNSIHPILEALSYRELDSLHTMVQTDEFSDAYFTNLKANVMMHYYATYLHDNYQRNGGRDVQGWINGVCTGRNNLDKRALAEALDLMRQRGTLTNVLNALTPRELQGLDDMIWNDQFSHDSFNEIRVNISTYHYEAHLNAIYQSNGGRDVQDWINRVCTGRNNLDKRALAQALDLMGQRRTLANVLNALTPRELQGLDNMIWDRQFSHASFNDIRVAISTYHYEAHLNAIYQRNGGHDVQGWVNGICTGQNNLDKRALAQALDLMGQRGTLANVLNALTTRELHELDNMIWQDQFSHASFNNLKDEVGMHYYAAYLHNNYQNNHGVDVRRWVNGVCDGRNLFPKIALANALELLRERGTLANVLGNFALADYGKLKNMLESEPLSRNLHYLNLKEVIETNIRDKKRSAPVRAQRSLQPDAESSSQRRVTFHFDTLQESSSQREPSQDKTTDNKNRRGRDKRPY